MRACRRVGRRPLGARKSGREVWRPYIRPNFARPVRQNETSGGPSKRTDHAARTGACGRVGASVAAHWERGKVVGKFGGLIKAELRAARAPKRNIGRTI